MGVQPGANGRAADAQAAQDLRRSARMRSASRSTARGISTKFLAQANRHGILQVGAPGLDDVIELDGFLAQRGGQAVHGCQQLVQAPERAQADGGGDGIVGGLGHVDVVVGVDTVFAQLTTQDLGGAVGNDLVGVHVVAGAGPGLEGIDDKLVVPAAVDDFLGGLDDGVGALGVEQTQVAVDFGSGALDHRHRPDEGAPGAQTRRWGNSARRAGSARRRGRLQGPAARRGSRARDGKEEVMKSERTFL